MLTPRVDEKQEDGRSELGWRLVCLCPFGRLDQVPVLAGEPIVRQLSNESGGTEGGRNHGKRVGFLEKRFGAMSESGVSEEEGSKESVEGVAVPCVEPCLEVLMCESSDRFFGWEYY